ncbi:MAG: S1 RNA-binding domain-containing protein [Myxococcales bacterium]|jgi:small subunit ribosomal protein S1
MSDETQRGGFGRKKAFPKTFGDVMKGIPAGKGGDRFDRREGDGRPPRQETEGRRERRGEPKGDRGKSRPPDERKGPVVVRKPVPLATKKDEGTAAPGATAAAPGAEEHERKGEPRRAPKTVFRRADGLNLPPREAEAEKAATAAPAPAPEIEEPPEESFAEMFAASERQATPKRFEVGQKVSGRIVVIGQDRAFLDLGGKGEAMIDIAELKDSNGNLMVSVGEILEGYVLALAGGIVVTKQLSKGAQREFLQEARDSGIPVEGLVTGHNKGGLEVDVGGMRGFCPISQIDVHFVENPAELVGQRLTFKVVELKDRDVVLSRRAHLEAEAAAKAEQLRERLHVGAQLEGKVTSLRDFGAFVDLGGLEGLVHVSEIAYGRIGHPREALEVGQMVRVEVVRIDPPKEGEKNERIALSMKALQQDPWQQTVATLHEGDQVRGKVVRLQPFGAFVEIAPGVDGLIHISALGAPRRIAHPKEVVSEGEEVLCVIESIDPAGKRIGLRRITGEEQLEAPHAAAQPAGGPPKVGDVFDVTVDKVETFGLFVKFPTGRGLIPNAEMGTPKGADHRKMFPPGTTFKAALIEIDNQGRMRLSKTAAEQAEERREYDHFMRRQEKASGKGFGTLGDLLKAKK